MFWVILAAANGRGMMAQDKHGQDDGGAGEGVVSRVIDTCCGGVPGQTPCSWGEGEKPGPARPYSSSPPPPSFHPMKRMKFHPSAGCFHPVFPPQLPSSPQFYFCESSGFIPEKPRLSFPLLLLILSTLSSPPPVAQSQSSSLPFPLHPHLLFPLHPISSPILSLSPPYPLTSPSSWPRSFVLLQIYLWRIKFCGVSKTNTRGDSNSEESQVEEGMASSAMMPATHPHAQFLHHHHPLHHRSASDYHHRAAGLADTEGTR